MNIRPEFFFAQLHLLTPSNSCPIVYATRHHTVRCRSSSSSSSICLYCRYELSQHLPHNNYDLQSCSNIKAGQHQQASLVSLWKNIEQKKIRINQIVAREAAQRETENETRLGGKNVYSFDGIIFTKLITHMHRPSCE